MGKGRGRGQPPKASDQEVAQRSVPKDDGHLLLSLRHIQPRFSVEEMSERQRSDFLVKWAKRCGFTWAELQRHQKHGLGFEMLPRKHFRPQVPESLEEDSYMVFRHGGNLPFAGFKAGDTFYVLWIEVKYGDLYKHG